jgi:hypothetical protein
MLERITKRLNLGFLVLFIINPLIILSFQNCTIMPSREAKAQEVSPSYESTKRPASFVEKHGLDHRK